jgi:hypothetical protein
MRHVFVALAVGLWVAVLVVLALFCAKRPGVGTAPTSAPSATSPKTPSKAFPYEWTSEEFDDEVIGKTPRELMTLLGKPERTETKNNAPFSDDPDYAGAWYYTSVQVHIRDHETWLTESLIRVFIEKGKTIRVVHPQRR